MIEKTLATAIGVVPIACLIYVYVMRDAKAEAGQIVSLVFAGAVLSWMMWVTSMLLVLLWR